MRSQKKVSTRERLVIIFHFIQSVDRKQNTVKYSNTYHHSIKRKPINADYSSLTENIESNSKALKFKVNDRVRVTKYTNIFSKGYTENWSREIFIIDSVLKTNPWAYKIKDLNGEKIIGSFYEKELLRSIL